MTRSQLIVGLMIGLSTTQPSVQAEPTGRPCTLDQVIDGDSLQLVCASRPVEVRLHCIDAPEHGQRPWGERSRTHLRRITPHRVELVSLEIDRFGRTVGDVYTLEPPRRLLNLEQVEQGQAAVYTRYCEDARFLEAQRAARTAGRGIWSRPGEHQTPWRYRHHH